MSNLRFYFWGTLAFAAIAFVSFALVTFLVCWDIRVALAFGVIGGVLVPIVIIIGLVSNWCVATDLDWKSEIAGEGFERGRQRAKRLRRRTE